MPDRSGFLSVEDQDKIKSWVDGKARAGYKCHTCDGAAFSLYSHLVTAPIADRDGEMDKTGFEVVGVVCNGCGLVSWYNADHIGVGTDAPYWAPGDEEKVGKSSEGGGV